MSFHLYQIDELYSNADGSIQFVELSVGNANGESFWQGQQLSARQGNATHSFSFPSDLPSQATANTTVLVATAGFANLGIATPDFIIPAGFLFTDGGAVNYAGVDSVSYSALPSDGTHSIGRDGSLQLASPRNFAGVTGSLPAGGTPASGTPGDDVIHAGAGNESINGGLGIDSVVFSGLRNNYTVTRDSGGLVVRDNVGTDGTDTLSNVERLQFADRKIAFDLSADGHAGQALEFIGMLAYPLITAPDPVGTILSIFDQGQSMHAVCQLAIDVGLTRNLAGSDSNLDLARLVYRNVVGTEASPDVAIALAAYIQGSGGTLSQADFMTAVAQLDLNQQHINLVGLQTVGVEYS